VRSTCIRLSRDEIAFHILLNSGIPARNTAEKERIDKLLHRKIVENSVESV
jgi:hypothetical protein